MLLCSMGLPFSIVFFSLFFFYHNRIPDNRALPYTHTHIYISPKRSSLEVSLGSIASDPRNTPIAKTCECPHKTRHFCLGTWNLAYVMVDTHITRLQPRLLVWRFLRSQTCGKYLRVVSSPASHYNSIQKSQNKYRCTPMQHTAVTMHCQKWGCTARVPPCHTQWRRASDGCCR